MPNPWIEHVRKYAKDNNLTYACAITHAKSSYNKKDGPKPKPKTDSELVRELESELKFFEKEYESQSFAVMVTPSIQGRRVNSRVSNNMKHAFTKYNQIKNNLEKITQRTYPVLQSYEEKVKQNKILEKIDRKTSAEKEKAEILKPKEPPKPSYVVNLYKKKRGAII